MTQYARPDGSVETLSNWSGAYTTIDEVSASDADYITGSESANGTAEEGLSDVNTPTVDTGHTVRFRAWQENATHQRTIVVQLLEGATVRSSYNGGTAINLVKGTPTGYEWTLSEAEAATITDYTNLRIKFTSGGTVSTPAASRSYVYMSWTELEVPDGAAATQYEQAAAGTLTSSGTVVKKPGKIVAGALTSSGTIIKQAGKVLAGALTSSGTVIKQVSKILAGALSSSGVLGAVKTVLLSLAGTLTSSGTVVKQANKILSGAVTSSGTIINSASKLLSGAVTSSGVLLKQAGKVLAGTLTSSGALGSIKTALVSLAGTLSSAGTVIKQTSKSMAGTLTTSGTIIKQVNKVIAGAVTSSGTLIKSISKIITGVLTSAGNLVAEATSSATIYYQSLAGTISFIGTGVRSLVKALSLGLLPDRNTSGTLSQRNTELSLDDRSTSGTLGVRNRELL